MIYNYDQLADGQEKLKDAMSMLVDDKGICQVREQLNVDKLDDAAKAVIAMECERVNAGSQSEPYDPIANPGQFDPRVVALAQALMRDGA